MCSKLQYNKEIYQVSFSAGIHLAGKKAVIVIEWCEEDYRKPLTCLINANHFLITRSEISYNRVDSGVVVMPAQLQGEAIKLYVRKTAQGGEKCSQTEFLSSLSYWKSK